MPLRRSAVAWGKLLLFYPQSLHFGLVLISNLCTATTPPLLQTPPIRIVPSLVPMKAPWNTSANSFERRMRPGRITPRRPSGLSVSPPNWRRHKPTGPSSGPNSPPLTPGLLVSRFFQSIVPFFLESLSLILCFSPGVTNPSPSRGSSHRHRVGECSWQHRRRPPARHPQPRPGGRWTWSPSRCRCSPCYSPVPN